MSRPNLRVVVFPSDDATLRADADAAIDRLPAALTNELARSAAERELRQWYRSMSIHVRDALGGYPDDPSVVWYVYRDGRIRTADPRLERLYAALAVARTVCHGSELAIDRARATARAAGYPERAESRAAGFEPVVARRSDGPPRTSAS